MRGPRSGVSYIVGGWPSLGVANSRLIFTIKDDRPCLSTMLSIFEVFIMEHIFTLQSGNARTTFNIQW